MKNIERKVFYVMVRNKDFWGLKEMDGFEIELGYGKFYAYSNRDISEGTDFTVYIVDPSTGLSIFDSTYCVETKGSELDFIKLTVEYLLASPQNILGKLQEESYKERYKLRTKIFDKYKEIEVLREQLDYITKMT